MEENDRPVPRPMAEILDALRTLAQSDGSLNAISEIIYRDWVLTVDTVEARVTDDPARRWSTDKLNTNELMLLLGLAVQSGSDRIWSVLPSDKESRAKWTSCCASCTTGSTRTRRG